MSTFQYVEKPELVLTYVLFPGQLRIWSLGFCSGKKKLENTEKHSQRKVGGNNKLNPHKTLS